MQTKFFHRRGIILFASALLLTGVLSSFESNDFRTQTVGAWDPNYYGTDTSGSGEDTTGSGSGSGEAPTNKTLTQLDCSISSTCLPSNIVIFSYGKKFQCLGNSGNCKPADESACDAGTPRCP